MEECKVLEAALKSCQQLQQSLQISIKEVRRLNVRYNLEWFVDNYNVYVANIWSQYQCLNDTQQLASSQPPAPQLATRMSKTKKRPPHNKLSNNLALSTRSSHELCGSNRRINYKFLKIKRGMEALLLQLQHAIEISNRQRNFMHLNVCGRDSRVRVCCH